MPFFFQLSYHQLRQMWPPSDFLIRLLFLGLCQLLEIGLILGSSQMELEAKSKQELKWNLVKDFRKLNRALEFWTLVNCQKGVKFKTQERPSFSPNPKQNITLAKRWKKANKAFSSQRVLLCKLQQSGLLASRLLPLSSYFPPLHLKSLLQSLSRSLRLSAN